MNSTSTYRALVVSQIATSFKEGIQSLALKTVPRKALAPGEARVRVHASALNFFDLLLLVGKYQMRPSLPFTIGNECSGVITEIGSEVKNVQIGQEVIMRTGEAMAEEVVAPSQLLVPKPRSMSHAQASGLMVGFMTAYHGLVHRGSLKRGEWLLVTGAAGGMGIAAIQVGKLLGARVIAAVSADDKAQACKQAGADHAINYTTEDMKERVGQITDGNFADVIYEIVGGEIFNKCVRCIASDGRLLVIGFASGSIPSLPANLALVKGFSLVGVRSGASLALNPHLAVDTFARLGEWSQANQLPAPLILKYPLTQYKEAFTALAERRAVWKIVIDWNHSASKL